jgi:hypothetical protein
MDQLLFALPRTAVKHEMMAAGPHPAAALPIAHHRPPLLRFGASFDGENQPMQTD